MSTILKALKKLESQQLPSQPATGLPYRRPDGPRCGFGGDRRFMALAISAAILVASFTTWLVTRLAFEPVQAPPAREITAPALPGKPVVPSGVVLPPAAPMFQTKTPPEIEASRPLPPPTPPALALPPESATPADALEIAAPPEIKAPIQAVVEFAPAAAPPASTAANQPTAAATTSDVIQEKPPTEKETAPLLPRLESSVLKLQAVTWADMPANRFAVLNNKIVRVGEAVEGYRIMEIGEDFLVVEQGGRRWEVRFRPR